MEYRTLRNSDLKVSRLCMGGCPMGGYGWGEVSRNELIKAVHCAIDKGINFFDTADVYGLGESERTLGEALKGRREKVLIATKFGVRRSDDGRTYYDNSPRWIEQALSASLERLGTDYIDLYQIHYLDEKTPVAAIVDTLDQLKSKGLIRYYGLSNITSVDIPKVKPEADKFISFQSEFSLADRDNEQTILGISKELGLTVLTWGSLGQGILSGKYGSNVKFDKNDRRSRDVYSNFHGAKLLHNMIILEDMKKISAETGKSLAAIAIRWILDYFTGSVAIVGAKSQGQVESNASALGWSLTEEQIKELKQISEYRGAFIGQQGTGMEDTQAWR